MCKQVVTAGATAAPSSGVGLLMRWERYSIRHHTRIADMSIRSASGCAYRRNSVQLIRFAANQWVQSYQLLKPNRRNPIVAQKSGIRSPELG